MDEEKCDGDNITGNLIPYIVNGSKSYSHRFIILSYVCGGDTLIKNFELNDDTEATLNALYSYYELDGRNLFLKSCVKGLAEDIFVGESGSSLRFLIPLALDGEEHRFYGSERLFQRPLDEYIKLFETEGIDYRLDGSSLTLKGRLTKNVYKIDGTRSSQFVSGMLMAGINKFSVRYKVSASRQYIDITLDAMKLFGIETNMHHKVSNPRREVIVPEDASNRSFFVALKRMNLLKGELPAAEHNAQRDYVFEEWTERLRSEYNLENNIDLAPMLAAYLAVQNGCFKITGVDNLIYKESDRLSEIIRVLKLFGVNVSYDDGNIYIVGGLHDNEPLVVDVDDHRICQMIIFLKQVSRRRVRINGIKCLNKSFRGLYNYIEVLNEF